MEGWIGGGWMVRNSFKIKVRKQRQLTNDEKVSRSKHPLITIYRLRHIYVFVPCSLCLKYVTDFNYCFMLNILMQSIHICCSATHAVNYYMYSEYV